MVVCLLFGWLVCTSSEQGGGFSSSEVFAAVRAQAARVVTVARTCSWVGFTCAPMCTSMCTILYTITCAILCTTMCTYMNNFVQYFVQHYVHHFVYNYVHYFVKYIVHFLNVQLCDLLVL